MGSELLTTNEAAAVLKVGASTVKRWADEGRLQCVKTAGGHRRFRRNDVAEMLDMGLSSDSEMDIHQLLDDDEGHACLASLYQMRSRYGAWWIVAERVADFLREVGEGWEAGRVSIVEEHTISERLMRALAAVCQALPASVDAQVCLFVMVEGDDHTLGLRLAELVAKELGWRSRWVGRNTPLRELEETINSGSIHAVATSASSFSTDTAMLRRQVQALEAMSKKAMLPLAFGGSGLWPEDTAYGKRVPTYQDFRQLLQSAAR